MIRLFIWIYALLFVLPVTAGVLSGTYAVGPGGDYASIGAALSAIQTNGLSGPMVLELEASYVSTAETFPLVFTNLGTTATNTLTLRPQVGATALSISSADTTAATVDQACQSGIALLPAAANGHRHRRVLPDTPASLAQAALERSRAAGAGLSCSQT